MNYKKGYLLFLLCGLLLASAAYAEDDDYYPGDYEGPGSGDSSFPPEDRSFPSEGPENQQFPSDGGSFPPGRFGPFPDRERPFSPDEGSFPPGRFGPFPNRERPFSPDRGQGQGGDNYDESIRPFDLSYLTKKNDPYFNAICTAKDRCVSNCDSTYQDGCVCYNDGTCTEQYVNRCHQCTDPNVFAVFERSTCPRSPYPEICSQLNQDRGFESSSRRHHHHRGSSKQKVSGLKVICSGEKLKSCVCDLQGDCTLRMLDICDVCQSNHFSAIFLNSTCPDNSLGATCNNTSVIPSLTTCNYPQAYSCQDQDRTSMQCNLQSSSMACVCYSNGTCASQPSSACACQNTNIVSVFAGSYCPTNCTNATQSTGEGEESEESENEEAENKGQTKKNEESEEKTESTAVNNQSTAVNNQNTTLTNFSELFTPKNPNRFVQCTLPYAYTCQDVDRGVTSCNETLVDSCICNNAGVCISVPTNKCKACANRDVVTVFENGSCSSRCRQFDAQNTTNSTPTNLPPSNADVTPITPTTSTTTAF